MKNRLFVSICFCLASLILLQANGKKVSFESEIIPFEKIPVLIVDGFSNHQWDKNTEYLQQILEASGKFEVSVSTCPDQKQSKSEWENWNPNFSLYPVVIQTCNNIFKEEEFQWPDQVKRSFEKYVAEGGGVYMYHGATNAFKNWPAYNQMIGLGWRNKDFGLAVTINEEEQVEIIPKGEGENTGHGKRRDVLISRMGNHPIHTGMPKAWLAADIEVYRYCRGTAENLEAISYAEDEKTGLNFPMEWVVRFGQGKVYSSTYGHLWKDQEWPPSMRCAAFQQTIVRALQWLSGNEVDNHVESDFPTGEKVVLRPPVPDEFEQLNASSDWKLQFTDPCTGKWQDKWFLDGQLARVENSEKGMDFIAGPVNKDDAHHAVLWTKASFKGDVKMEYNYTRTDSQVINVNILFIQATGIGGEAFDPDITQWNDYRTVPTMSKYWKNMNLIHISYAAFPTVNEDPDNDYLRVRRYPATENIPFSNTEVPPAFERTGLFLPDVTYKMTWIKTGEQLLLKVAGDGKVRQYSWDLTGFDPVTEGRIGLRHMYTRSARYSDFKVYTRKDDYQLQNPMSEAYLKDHLRKELPRLVLNKEIEAQLKRKLKTDPLIRNLYAVIRENAESLLATDLITLDIPDNPNSQKNQLGISRNFLYRINMLAMVYRIAEDPKILRRINDEVVAACNFPSWNPRHFLDVGEMSLAIALAIDWTAGKLPKSTIDLAQRSLIEKGIKPSWPEDGSTPNWVYGTNNWNQVCNAGMIAAAISVAEIDPELAAKTMKRSIDGMNRALAEYDPDGAYPEGAIYWGYGTMFSVVTAAMLESALGTDLGMADYPGFKESAVFRMLMTAPSKRLFNYADCGEIPERYTDFTLSWFAAKTGNKTYLNEERFMLPPDEIGRISRLAGAGLVWTAQFQETATEALPTAWKGEGANPLVVFNGGEGPSNGYYFGGKGGQASLSHGNMDSGSFIFELNGVRWVIDPGNQGYGPLERAGFKLWGRCQECDRWKLLTKNNFGHSTISVNDQLHLVDAKASILDFTAGAKPEATIDLSPTLAGQLTSARRRFVKDSPASLLIEDHIELSEATKLITWQLITTADVSVVKGGALLKQDGKQLKLENLSHPDLQLSVVSLYPGPLEVDKQMEGLKRIELRIPAWTVEGDKTKIRVRLSGE